MAGGTSQKDLVWISPEEYSSSVDGGGGSTENIELLGMDEHMELPSIVIINGIHLKQKGESQPFALFSYCCGPMMESPSRVDWKFITLEPIVSQHILCHQLKEGDDISKFISKCNPEFTHGLILINTEDAYPISRSFKWDGMTHPSFPVCVLTRKDGEKLLGMIQHQEVGDVLARIEAQSVTEAQARRVKSPSPEELSLTLEQAKGRKPKVPRPFHRPRIDLKKKLKEIMSPTPATGPLCVSENKEMFEKVMAEFHSYEQSAKTKPHDVADNSRVFQKLNKFIAQTEVFNKDCMFYILLAYRVFRFQNAYLCDEHAQFIHKCITKFEEMATQMKVDAILKFIESGDFIVVFDEDYPSTSVFSVMERACIILMKESQKMRSRGLQGSHLRRSILSKMIWLSVSLKFKSTTGPRDGSKVWYDNMTKEPECHSMDSQSIDDFEFGLRFGQKLELSVESSFGVEQMSQLLCSKNFVRPFCQLSEFIKKIEPHVHVQEDFLAHLISHLREPYRLRLEPATKSLENISTYGNLLGAVQEGLTFLDNILKLWKSKGWSHQSYDHQMLLWVRLLLGAVDVTSDKTTSYLKEFVSQIEHPVCGEYQKQILEQVIADIRKNFNRMSIIKFSRLYENFYIWPLDVVQDYLQAYTIPARTNINDPIWVTFFSLIVERFGGAENHGFIFEFLITVGDHYLQERRPKDFIFHLLDFNISGLFAIDTSKKESTNALSVRVTFKTTLREYIQRHRLTSAIISHVTAIWKSISQMSQFQLLVLSVLQEELIPESRNLQTPIRESIKPILEDTIGHLCYDASWLEDLTQHQKFAFGVVSVCCSRVPANETLDWMSSYDQVISKLGRIYTCYCEAKGLLKDERVITEIPDDVAKIPCAELHAYFQWIIDVHEVLSQWCKKFSNRLLNYDEIQEYHKFYMDIDKVGVATCALPAVMKSEEAEAARIEYLKLFECLNCLLIKYIPGHPEHGWRLLRDVLTEYGIEIPQKIMASLNMLVNYPDEPIDATLGDAMINTFSPSFTGTFKPGHDISLTLTRGMTLLNLKILVNELNKLLEPIQENIDLLTYFFLRKSAIFDTYLRYQLRKHNALAGGEPVPSLSISRIPSISGALVGSMRRNVEPFRGISWKVLADALRETKELVVKLVEGTAEYTDVTAGGNLELEKMEIDVEFRVLVDYTKILQIGPENHDGLRGIQCMLELFQYTNDIHNIYSVCEQYHMKGCLGDVKLQEIKEIADELQNVTSRNQLTPKEAIQKVNKIVKALCLQKKGLGYNRQCLRLFPAVSDSAVFYQLLKDKEFYGEEGQEIFRQKYELITAQLQHEEYKEIVLNHLYTAYKVISPFLDDTQDFGSLMVQVSNMNIASGCKELHTVNKNIHLVRLWFSRAEEDTLEVVPAELEAILSTGEYQFIFDVTSDGTVARLFLEYQPPYVAQALSTPMKMSESQIIHDFSDGSPDVNESIISHRDSTDYQYRATPLPHRESSPPPLRIQRWSSEQIRDFEQRIGFLDPEKSLTANINKFLMLNQNAYALLELYQRLKDLGHPLYTQMEPHRRMDIEGQPMEILPFRNLPCNLSEIEVQQCVDEANAQLKDWSFIVSDLHRQFETLLFFNIPKLLHLHAKLSEGQTDNVVGEISFLFKNNIIVREKLKATVKSVLPVIKASVESCSAPMEVVGTFLHKLFVEEEMNRFALQPRQPYRHLARTVSAQSSTILHSCHGLSRTQLMSLIINCYNGVPECFQLFRCQPFTTEDELNLFLNRVAQHPFQYMIIGVEKLPYQLQESLLQFQLRSPLALMPDADAVTCLNFVETGPSVLREMPWIMVKDHKDGTALSYERAKKISRQGVMAFEDFHCITLVYGHAGDGKSHLIRTRLRNRLSHMVLNIPISEAFTPLSAIKKLQALPTDTRGCCIYFNFTMLPPSDGGIHEAEKTQYHQLMEVVNWFFFDLLVLGYVEDITSGESFRLPGGLSWAVFIEVPSRGQHVQPCDSIQQFLEDLPTLGLVGNKEFVEPRRSYIIDEDVQLVCKYLKAYETVGKTGIDKLYKESSRKGKPNPPVKFSLNPDLERDECLRLLEKYTPTHMKNNKTSQKLFVSYMKRRCHFLDNLPAYNYNTGGTEMITNAKGKRVANNTRQLGSTLMRTFLKEVEEFCDPTSQADWSKKPHQQLIYDTVDGGSSIGLISLGTEKIPQQELGSFQDIGIELPTVIEIHTREWLDDYLSRALTVPLSDIGRLKIIDDSGYVLTLDYTLKMLNIHERHECGTPVIIEGETGVGKTALVEVLSKLWNSAHLYEWDKTRDTILEFIRKKMDDLLEITPERKEACLDIVSNLSSGKDFSEMDIQILCELPDAHSPSAQFYSILRKEVLKLKDDPVLSLLEQPETESKKSFNFLFRAAEYKNNPKATAELLYGILNTKVKPTFHKLNVHAALKPSDVINFFKEVADQANEIQDAYNKCKEPISKLSIPSVTVFLDEVNTASCLGLFKEIIVDKTIDGVDLPSNIFIIGACNPHRGDSLAVTAKDSSWIRSNYYVRTLHPTLDMLKWDYGSLDEYQERDYINAKLRLMDKEMSNVELANLAELIVTSQNLLRAFAFKQLKMLGVEESNALKCSKSCVSQRDIQRVFTFYEWLMKLYVKYQPHGVNEDYHLCAIMVSLAIVYYMRLDSTYRGEFSEVMDKSSHLNAGISFTDAFLRELEWFINKMDIPQGIAKTQALKENIFSTIICTMTYTPLIIVGPPGCSKTLSFNLVTANLRGQESKVKLFRDTELFRSLDPHYYQCSHRTTSNEIQTVFSRAVNRQRNYSTVPLPINCVVFMDEAGLPEEGLESLKVLHYHLDRREVCFVAISNHMLDAAKTNRAVSLYRSEPSIDELRTLAKGCICDTPNNPPAELKKDIDIIVKFCPIYHSFMERPEFRKFYGLRDFIHFINYLKRNRRKGISEILVLEALERNFNGHKMFESICKEFLSVISEHPQRLQRRNILRVLKESLNDKPQEQMKENEVRYKLIIDSSEDSSLLRLLFAFGVLKERDTRTYVYSDFPGDTHQQMINTIAAIRHSASAGHTVIMSQTDEIHESFYDLFNQRFRRIDDTKTGPRFYANIAIGAHHKPCRIHPSFQCLVVVKHSEVDKIPHPFLNRFEKYALTHKILLDAVLNTQPAYLKAVLQRAKEKASEFIDHVGGKESLYGLHDDTLDSLVLSLLPPVGFQEFLETDKPQKEEDISTEESPDVFLLRRLLRALRKRAGFRLPHFTREELAGDAEYVMQLVARDSQFAGQLSSLTHKDVLKAIPEALSGLYHSNKGGRTDLSIIACMVISVFLQWLVRHLCKRLMQLMTTEALTTRYRSLPHRYTETYLKHQSHFNLQAVVEKQLQVMMLDDRLDRSTTGTANRLLLFTRSSALIHQLPARYPAPNSSSQLTCDYDALVQKLIYYYKEDVCVCKLSSITSQSSMNDLLNSFWLSKTQRIILLVANMKETSQEMISHLRVMIEENDTGEKLKLFVLLLHFPPSMFNRPCYSTLFSNTWDHHYLDIIGQNTTGQVMDICEWFSLCCSYLSSRHNPQQRISLHLSALLQEAIPIISSRVFFGKIDGASFNCLMEVPQRYKALKQLFDSGVGEILCERFLKYWEPGVMLEYLEKAASLTTAVQTNVLSITDSLQTILRDTFFDFIVHMVSKMNEDMNIDILMDPGCTEATQTLFLSLLRAYPMPKLSQVKTLSSFANSISSLEASQHAIFTPKFPFFRLVSSGLEKIIEQTRKEINQRLDTLHEFPDPIFSLTQMSISSLPKVIEDKSHLVMNMQKAVEFTIKEILESTQQTPLKVGIQAMLDDPAIFKRYSEAFTHQKLRLGSSSAGISFKILRLTFMQLHPDQDMLTRLALLHICMHVYQLDLSRLVQVLRPLDTLLDMAAIVTDDPFAETQPSPTASFLSAVQESGDVLGQPGDLSKYVLRILFSALVGSILGQSSEDRKQQNVALWYEVYRDVMSMSAVRDYLYKNFTELSETQHNIMHATYLVIMSHYNQDDRDILTIAQRVFTILFKAHFSEKMELNGDPPRLHEVTNILVQELLGSSVDVAIQHHNPVLRRIFEGSFAHFFSTHRTSPNLKDCQWFLELVNKNTQWNADSVSEQIKAARVSESLVGDSPPLISGSSSPTEDHRGNGCIPISIYKHYLMIILDKADVSNFGTSSMTSLALYKPWMREKVGKVLVKSKPQVKAAPYIPTYYQVIPRIQCPTSIENQLMQQPLSHLYFVTVLHHLLSNKFGLAGLVRVASSIASNLQEDVPVDEKVLLHIEHQAIIQAVIQQLAKSLNPSDPNGISAVAAIIADINLLLNDKTLGGSSCGGHGIALALNLLKQLGSVSSFTELLKPDSFYKDFNCLVDLSSSIDIAEEHHLFPFLFSVGKGNVLKDLYVSVGQAMLKAHTSGGRKSQQLMTIANEWSQGQVTISLPDGQDVQGERSSIFRMVLWLNTYHKFYCMKRTSPALIDMLKKEDQLLYTVQPTQLNKLICCFLDPSLMIQEQTAPHGDISNYNDPVYMLFNPNTKDSLSDESLRHALANLIAVVVAAPPTSTHLWYHMFAAEQLHRTHIAGFMLETLCGEDEMFYDEGVQLTSNGFYGQHNYVKHATRGTLSIQSLYLLLWANAGAFCVGLLTDPEAENKLLGSVFPEHFTVRHFCMSQLRSLWKHLSVSLGISVEERSFLVSRCMWNLMKIACGSSTNMLAGKFSNITSLNHYESQWHINVFMPVWRNLKDSFAQHANLYIHQIFRDIQTLEAHYPFFPTEEALSQALLSQTDIGDYISNSEHLLAEFTFRRYLLEIGGQILPDLVELYQWLHQELAYVITREDAETIPISRAVRVLAKSYSPEEGERLQILYKRLRDSYNMYREMTGYTLPPLEDATPLLHALSCSTNGDSTPDLLYAAISDIITTHNNFLVKAENTVRLDPDSFLTSYLSQEFTRVHPTEFTNQNCIVETPTDLHGLTEFSQLICRRSALPSPVLELSGNHTSLPGYLPSLINLKMLQEDMFAIHIAGKPLIGPPQSLRSHFAFKDATHHTKENLSAIEADMMTISNKLLDEFKAPMDDQSKKELKVHFHSSSYHTIMETVSGLRGVAGHLIKKLMGVSQIELMELQELSLAEFLSSVFGTNEPLKSITGSKKSIFTQIGIYSLTQNQFSAIENVQLIFLHDALRWFVTWASQGWYEYSSLAFSMKAPLSIPDEEALYALPDRYTDSDGQLLKDLKVLKAVLQHFESTQITSMALKNVHLPIVELLNKLGECTEQEELLCLIPESVLIENYVAFRVTIKKVMIRLQKQSSSESLSVHPHKQSWEDFVDDLWKNNLSNFRHGNYSYAVIMTADQKKRVYSLRNIDRSDEELLNDLMTAGVSESELLPDTDADEETSSNSDSPFMSTKASHVPPPLLPRREPLMEPIDSFATAMSYPKRDAVTKKLAGSYSCEQVCEFLKEIGLEEYIPKFGEYGIVGEVLLQAGQGKGLEEIGVTSALHRLKIHILFRRRLEGVGKVAKRYPVTEVIRFLHANRLSDLVETFEKHQIDGEILMEASDEVLEELGIEKQIQRIALMTHFRNYITPRFTTL